MANVIFSAEYEALVELLTEWRMCAGLSQRELARRLGRSQSHVHRIESRQRRLEIVEFCRYARAVGLDPVAAFEAMVARLKDLRKPAHQGARPECHVAPLDRQTQLLQQS